MTTVGSYEAKTHLPALLERVVHGERIVITRRGVPVALLSPPARQSGGDLRVVVEEMLGYRETRKRTLGKVTARQLIKEGRRF
jgi:prevent-host-death family protein